MVGSDARALAATMSADLEAVSGAPLRFRGIDLAPALEQVLFSSLRAGALPPTGLRRKVLGPFRRPAAVASALRGSGAIRPADVMVLLLAGVHRSLFSPVAESLARLHPEIEVVAVTAGRAARDARLEHLPTAARQMTARSAIALLAHRVDRRAIARATRSWDGVVGRAEAAALRGLVAETIDRLAVEASRIDAAIAAARPRVVATYDEIDAWGRLLASVAHRHGAIAVDLPHAEAVDVEAIRGADYDLMGVYGPRAAAVVEAAGIPPERIEIVGPARFDALVRTSPKEVDRPSRVVLAGQYRARNMTDGVRAGVLAAAIAAAAAIDGILQIKPHPVEVPRVWEPLRAAAENPHGVEVRIEEEAELHDLLPGAAVLVTGWSNSVYEAVLAGVPAITLHLLDGLPPMPFAAEGIASEARDAASAARQARALVVPGTRRAALITARAALAEHLGPLDGAAAERSAALVARAAQG